MENTEQEFKDELINARVEEIQSFLQTVSPYFPASAVSGFIEFTYDDGHSIKVWLKNKT